MSFLAGRLASTEGSYFLQESKQAVARLARNQKNTKNVVKPVAENNEISSADVLPEVLRHSLPPKIFHSPTEDSGSSFTKGSKWVLKPDPNRKGARVCRLMRLILSQLMFLCPRWQLPNSDNSVLASTANDLRNDKYTPINPEKLKAAAAGLSQSKLWLIGSAFAVATAIVFGGATLIFGLAASKLELHNLKVTVILVDVCGEQVINIYGITRFPSCLSGGDFKSSDMILGTVIMSMVILTDDIRTKGKDLVQPKFEMFKERLVPLRTWAEGVSKKWHLEREESMKERPLIKELSRKLGAKTSKVGISHDANSLKATHSAINGEEHAGRDAE
ncbi:hypothetical protein DH2020_025075 [Rehmannia glutinosa]|uniref:Uncharacterized protein n=1 Tax=Rehmannia glutinosa TaxID=99300 RepID=A0ABR0W4N3_REHGL